MQKAGKYVPLSLEVEQEQSLNDAGSGCGCGTTTLSNEQDLSVQTTTASSYNDSEENSKIADSPSDEENDDEWDEKEDLPLELNYDALKHVAYCFLPGPHGRCTNIEPLQRGSYHEIRILEFEDGWSCIGRFTRDRDEHLGVLESEVATVRYVREHTGGKVPVPEIFFVNTDPSHPVGAPFVLMERIPGKHLYSIWEKLTTDHKKSVIEQISTVLAELAGLKFDKIGSINTSGEVGPLQNKAIPDAELERGPFATMVEYKHSFIPDEPSCQPELRKHYSFIKRALHEDLEELKHDPLYKPPFRLIHGDFDGQNMLFTWDADQSQPPKLSGIIDWDYSYTGPLYYLYEYPLFIQDYDAPGARELYAENKIIRKHLVRELANRFPKGSEERADVHESFRQKCYMHNAFNQVFMTWGWTDAEHERDCVEYYTDGLRGIGEKVHEPYSGTDEWKPDSEIESENEAEGEGDGDGDDV